MAQRLQIIYGTQKDRVNCPFYSKIGACKYMDKCQRRHNYPKISQTILMPHMYSITPIDSALANKNQINSSDHQRATNRFQEFYEDVFKYLANFGMIQDMIVCDNLTAHLVGNVYVKFVTQEDAQSCFINIKGKYYAGVQIKPQYSPVIDFSNAKCKQELQGSCKRLGNCNYMHLKPISSSFKKLMFQEMIQQHPQYKRRRRNFYKRKERSRSKSQRKRSRSRSQRRRKRHSSSQSDKSQKRRAKIQGWNKQN